MKQLKKILTFVCMTQSALIALNAQVTIGADRAPADHAILELVAASATSAFAFLPPKVELTDLTQGAPAGGGTHLAGMMVYNTKTDAAKGIEPGMYYNDGARWHLVVNSTKPAAPKWFYMPSIVIDVSQDVVNQTIQLHQLYLKQFYGGYTGIHGTSQLVKSTSAPNHHVPYIANPQHLYYYVTGYDPDVFYNLSINDDGDLTYSVHSDQVSDATFINIVLVEK
jgi:hypothetical protein